MQKHLNRNKDKYNPYTLDIDEETKKKMTVEELVRKFTETGEANDRVLLH